MSMVPPVVTMQSWSISMSSRVAGEDGIIGPTAAWPGTAGATRVGGAGRSFAYGEAGRAAAQVFLPKRAFTPARLAAKITTSASASSIQA
ncbi:hypothetical protein [Lysobacter gummosus]|uniref:hypothetical protein n=1 Tax=Lysobacter gummosus TaxID=262324 RepID=UPI003625DDC9